MSARRKSVDDALRATEVRLAEFEALVRTAIARWTLTTHQRRVLEALLGTAGCLTKPSMADLPARRQAIRLLIRTLQRLRQQRWRAGKHRFYLVTLIDPAGYVSDRSPQVSIKAIRHKARKALKAMGLDAVAVTEVQAIINFPRRGHGRTLMFHTHAIAWPANRFRKEIRTKLNQSRAWRSPLGVRPISVKVVTDRVGELEWLAYYLLKPPYDAKNRQRRLPKRGHPAAISRASRHRLVPTTAGYRPELALRIVEALTQMSLTANVYGVGTGQRVVSGWRRRLRQWHDERLIDPDRRTLSLDVAAFWRGLRKGNGSRLFGPYRLTDTEPATGTDHDPFDDFLRLLQTIVLAEKQSQAD